jgi:predicted RNA-binding Zn ribbon-like protein
MPAQSKEAPGDLALVRGFVNTLDMDLGKETLDTPEHLAEWLWQAGLLAREESTGADALERSRSLREALRELLLSNNDGHPPEPSAAVALDEVAARAGLRLRAGADGRTWLEAQAPGVDGALGRLMVIVHESMAVGTWARLKACRNDTCRWAFYDHSKNRSGHWCTMSVCGNRQKVRGYRERNRAGASHA